jgi:hypothetical protein
MPFTILGAALGSLITWAITKYFNDAKWRRHLQDTTTQSLGAMDRQDQFYATHAMLYVSALRALESGDSESAKRDLASGAAVFYMQFRDTEQSQWIQAQKRDVESLAKSSQVLREALETQRNDAS